MAFPAELYKKGMAKKSEGAEHEWLHSGIECTYCTYEDGPKKEKRERRPVRSAGGADAASSAGRTALGKILDTMTHSAQGVIHWCVCVCVRA